MAESTVQTIEIDAPPVACFDVASDIPSYPEWATGVRSIRIIETDAEGRVSRAHFTIDGMVKEISYTLTYHYDRPHRITWSADPGDDLDGLEGSYVFNDLEGDKTEVIYALRAEPAFTIPGFLKRQVEKQIVGTALRGLRRRVEDSEDV